MPGSFNRRKEQVKAIRLLVLESDELSQIETVAAARWVEDEFSLPLLALVHSGNRSLHCYFNFPGLDWVSRYRQALGAVGFDVTTFRPTQPVRLANQMRPNNRAVQQLLWLREAPEKPN